MTVSSLFDSQHLPQDPRPSPEWGRGELNRPLDVRCVSQPGRVSVCEEDVPSGWWFPLSINDR